MRLNLLYLLTLFLSLFTAANAMDAPAAYKGRVRPCDVYAREWLEEIYHRSEIKTNHKGQLPNDPTSLLWKLHFEGFKSLENAPLFSVQNSAVKQQLGLELKQEHFSYQQLHAILQNQQPSELQELAALRQKLIAFEQLDSSDRAFLNTVAELKAKNLSEQELVQQLEQAHPLKKRLSDAGPLFQMIPSRIQSGVKSGQWFSLKALKTQIYKDGALAYSGNFSAYSNETFQKIRQAYLELENAYHHSPAHFQEKVAVLDQLLHSGYQSLAGQPYLKAEGKELRYPTENQLKAETVYYRYPWLETTVGLYLLALVLFLTPLTNRAAIAAAVITFVSAVIIHTATLALRVFILARPPVSNMFESVLYVPWVCMLFGIGLWIYQRQRLLIIASTTAAVLLLLLLRITYLNIGMENVQAVLDSQYWLIIHVLMVVGSYGAFILSSLCAHQYLFQRTKQRHAQLPSLANAVLQTMYIGTALLIPGTILGGVWAAESWGRFWDWDPKESWAFIYACTYVIVIHLYRYRLIHDRGLAIGAIIGGMVISFTWYGVNYILGTGLHSYGFGSGGEIYYFAFLGIETAIIGSVMLRTYLKYQPYG
jgi:ABC-type transport system involved in cytochrome c biogenesis permease subunit